MFFFGADYTPPIGFDQTPQLKFLENKKGMILPTASTCSLTLWLPIMHQTYDDFKTALTSGIIDNDGFGGGP